MPERRAKNEIDRRSTDPNAYTDDRGLWTMEAATPDPVGVEEVEGKKKGTLNE